LPEWREATHRIAITILELQRLNRLREKIRSEIGGDPALPAYALPRVLCGDGSFVGDGVYLFLQQAFAAGFPAYVSRRTGARHARGRVFAHGTRPRCASLHTT